MSVSSSGVSSISTSLPRVIAFGEIIWDLFGETRRLGGAPLNFAAQVHALGHRVTLISALGDDSLGREAREQIEALGLDTRMIETSPHAPTGTATVNLSAEGEPVFSIARPAAYDTLEQPLRSLEIGETANSWFYFGSLVAAIPQGRHSLDQLLTRFRHANRFLDLNLRPGTDAPEFVTALLASANVVKLNEAELARVCEITGLPHDPETFCHAGSERFGWRAVCVTLGARGCCLSIDDEFVEAPGVPVTVADTVGAGDAFAAAFIHGLSRLWPAQEVAVFANSLGAKVAAHPGSLPESGG
jgi:fructokinase